MKERRPGSNCNEETGQPLGQKRDQDRVFSCGREDRNGPSKWTGKERAEG